jgi:hypothetical protein
MENIDTGVRRAWDRKGKAVKELTERGGQFHWNKLPGRDKLLHRQVYMMREGRMALINMIFGAHGKLNRF